MHAKFYPYEKVLLYSTTNTTTQSIALSFLFSSGAAHVERSHTEWESYRARAPPGARPYVLRPILPAPSARPSAATNPRQVPALR